VRLELIGLKRECAADIGPEEIRLSVDPAPANRVEHAVPRIALYAESECRRSNRKIQLVLDGFDLRQVRKIGQCSFTRSFDLPLAKARTGENVPLQTPQSLQEHGMAML